MIVDQRATETTDIETAKKTYLTIIKWHKIQPLSEILL